jgi:hypothetical protein
MNQDQVSSTMRGRFTHANHEMVADLFDMSWGPAATKSSLLVCLFVFVGLGLTTGCNSAGISACNWWRQIRNLQHLAVARLDVWIVERHVFTRKNEIFTRKFDISIRIDDIFARHVATAAWRPFLGLGWRTWDNGAATAFRAINNLVMTSWCSKVTFVSLWVVSSFYLVFSPLVFFKQVASSGPGVVLGILVRSQNGYHPLGRCRKSGDHLLEDLAKSGCKSEIK